MATNYLFRCVCPPGLRIALTFIKPRPHELIEGFGARDRAGAYCKKRGFQRVLIMTDANLRKLGLLDKVTESLDREGISYAIFDEILPNPSFSMIEKAKAAGLAHKAECIVALGGGSVLDAAKVVSGCLKAPRAGIKRMATSLTTMFNNAVPIVNIPTTAGTGAETTLGVVTTDDATHRKRTGFTIYLRVGLVILDSELTLKCPPRVTAATGFDALSHGVEAAMANVKPKGKGKNASMDCTRMVFENLPAVYRDGDNKEARLNMAKAAYLGGVAINTETLGYAHSFGHALGGLYDIPHGEALAVTLPVIMRFQKDVSREDLARLAVGCGFGEESESKEILAERFIEKVIELRDSLGLPGRIEIKREDYPALIENAFHDSNAWIVKRTIRYAEAEKILDAIAGA